MEQLKSPSIILQQSGESPSPGFPTCSWDHSESIISKDNYAITVKPLETIPGVNGILYRNATSQLWTSGYNFNNTGTIVGIEVLLNAQRLARVQDYVVQLCLNGELIGDNKANEDLSNSKVYGSNTDLWGTELTADMLNTTFGVVLSFQSHMYYPHRDLGYIDQVSIRVHYG